MISFLNSARKCLLWITTVRTFQCTVMEVSNLQSGLSRTPHIRSRTAPMVDPVLPRRGSTNRLFSKIFAENCKNCDGGGRHAAIALLPNTCNRSSTGHCPKSSFSNYLSFSCNGIELILIISSKICYAFDHKLNHSQANKKHFEL